MFHDTSPTRPAPVPGWSAAFTTAVYHWERLRASALVPQRSDLDPAPLLQTLKWAAIVAQDPPEADRRHNLRFRVAGHRLSALAGVDLGGLPLPSLMGTEDRGKAVGLADLALSTPAAVFATVKPGPDPNAAATTLALLPLSDAQTRITRLLLLVDGVRALAERPAPGRLRICTSRSVVLAAGRPLLKATSRAAAPSPFARSLFAPPLAGPPRPVPSHRAGPMLRVIEGGRA